jgi:subtilisin-like proprotein convertase family protein
VRDNNPNKPQTAYRDVQVIVSDTAGPFIITSPAANYSTAQGSTLNVAWDVAGTDTGAFNAQNVKISLVTDEGETIQTLLENVPNNGSASVTLPSGFTVKKAKIMVEAADNIFFALSDNFSIGYELVSVCKDYTYTGGSVSIPDAVANESPGAWAVISINIPEEEAEGEITSIKASVSASHSYNLGDVRIVLESPEPNPAQAILWDVECYSGNSAAKSMNNVIFDDNATARTCSSTITGSRRPYGPIKQLYQADWHGDWLLKAADYTPQNTGSLAAFSLNICSTKYTLTKLMNTNEVRAEESSLQVYPNPSSGKFYVNNKNLKGKITVKVYNTAGELLLQTQETDPEFIVDLGSRPSGVYLMSVENNGNKTSKKLIKN